MRLVPRDSAVLGAIDLFDALARTHGLDHRLTLHTDGGDYLVHWCRTAGPGEAPKFYPVSNGRTAEEAIDNAIARYEKKHGRKTS